MQKKLKGCSSGAQGGLRQGSLPWLPPNATSTMASANVENSVVGEGMNTTVDQSSVGPVGVGHRESFSGSTESRNCLCADKAGMRPYTAGFIGKDGNYADTTTEEGSIENQYHSAEGQDRADMIVGNNDDGNKVILAVIAALAGTASLLLNANCTGGALLALAYLENEAERKENGRYLRAGAVPKRKHSLWLRCDELGDEMEFFHFTSLSRQSFETLVTVLQATIKKIPLRDGFGAPQGRHVTKRMFKPRDIVAMTLKFLLSSAGHKDLHVQFGAIASVYSECISLGMSAIIRCLVAPPFARVHWDRSENACLQAAERTKGFAAIPKVVAMMDGLKLKSQTPSDWRLQNRDYNGWTGDVNRNMVLVWDPWGKIVDAAVNTPGSFHDSKSAQYCGLYDHIASLPDGYKVVCDSAFQTSGVMTGKLVKVKDLANGVLHDEALTHLRQCSEWGNNILTGSFRRLRAKLPTDNSYRAKIQWCCILLHNWRTHTCDRNQIKTYFNNLE